MRYLVLVSALSLTFALAACDDADDPGEEPGEVVDEQPDQQLDDETDEVTDGPADDADEPDLAEDLPAGQTRHFGEQFSIDDDPIQLTEALDELDGDKTPTVKVASRVKRVCEKKGCWFTLDDDEVELPVRIRMKDYGFFVPRNTEGADAVIEGAIERTEIDEDLARHYAEDVGDDPDEIDGPQPTFRFVATGVSMHLPES